MPRDHRCLFDASPDPKHLAPGQKRSGWWYFYFVDENRPEGDRFVGAVVVPGADVIEAIEAAGRLGCDPGGTEAKGLAIVEHMLPSEAWRNRLLSKTEANELMAWAAEREAAAA